MSKAIPPRMAEWLPGAPQVPGTILRGVRWADGAFLADGERSDFPPAALELAWRTAADTFEVLNAQRFPPTRLSWIHEQNVFHCARRADGAILGIILPRARAASDPAALDKLFGEFLELAV
jgi:hypothetical protein